MWRWIFSISPATTDAEAALPAFIAPPAFVPPALRRALRRGVRLLLPELPLRCLVVLADIGATVGTFTLPVPLKDERRLCGEEATIGGALRCLPLDQDQGRRARGGIAHGPRIRYEPLIRFL
jgi:hypothetical protein